VTKKQYKNIKKCTRYTSVLANPSKMLRSDFVLLILVYVRFSTGRYHRPFTKMFLTIIFHINNHYYTYHSCLSTVELIKLEFSIIIWYLYSTTWLLSNDSLSAVRVNNEEIQHTVSYNAIKKYTAMNHSSLRNKHNCIYKRVPLFFSSPRIFRHRKQFSVPDLLVPTPGMYSADWCNTIQRSE